ncbi:MAG: hypothetical protein GC149_03410 [Gammaproteobacteria bacterium]|nr:hypothetical protein [Gammaproteobacteria bacterium]
MLALIRLFWDICTFRRGPQDVPHSFFLLGSLLLVKLAIELVIFYIPNGTGATLSLSAVVPYMLADAAIAMGVVYLIVWLNGYAARGLQTVTATVGVDIVLTIAQLPFKYLVSSAGNQADKVAIFYFGTMLIFLWELGIYSHVFRHALSTSIFKAGGYALLCFILSFVIYYQMLPVAG